MLRAWWIAVLLCVTLLFGFNAGHLLTPDLVPGDAIGFEMPLVGKLVLLGIVSLALTRFRHAVIALLATILCFIAGLHVSFDQAGPLTGSLYGVLPLGIEIPVCHSDDDNALKFLEQSPIDDGTLARFHQTVTCAGKSGAMLGYGTLWSRTGPS